MNFEELRQLAKETETFTEEMFKTLMEFTDYNSNGMRVIVIEVLSILKERIIAGEEIKFYESNEILTLDNFTEIIWETFGEEICEDVFKISLD